MKDRVSDEELTMLALQAQSRLIDVEKENAALRQLVKDLLAWTSEGFSLFSDAQKAKWQQRYEVLQQDVKDLLGEKVPQ